MISESDFEPRQELGHVESVPESEAHERVALVHVLTPGFQGLDPSDFDDISDAVVERASPEVLRAALLDTANTPNSPLHGRDNKGKSVVSYRTGDSGKGIVWLSVTPQEYGLFSRSVEMLARTAFNDTLASRDKKIQEETGNKAAKAREDDDIAAANRSAIRQVTGKLPRMEQYLDEDIMSRIQVIEKFQEMTRHRNLNRGTHETVQAHFEHLRLFVFGDMLDAVSNQKGWSASLTERAVRILQKRLYIDGSPADRVSNFKELLDLAEEYYGHKRAFVLTRIWETREYVSRNHEAAEDVKRVDAERANEK